MPKVVVSVWVRTWVSPEGGFHDAGQSSGYQRSQVSQGQTETQASVVRPCCATAAASILQVSHGKENNIRRSWIFRYQPTRAAGPRYGAGVTPRSCVWAMPVTWPGNNECYLKDGLDPIVERDRTDRQERCGQCCASSPSGRQLRPTSGSIGQGWKNIQPMPGSGRRRSRTYAYPAAGPYVGCRHRDRPRHAGAQSDLAATKLIPPNDCAGRIEQVLGWATASRLSQGSEAATTGQTRPAGEGHLDKLLAAPSARSGPSDIKPRFALRGHAGLHCPTCMAAKALQRYRLNFSS